MRNEYLLAWITEADSVPTRVQLLSEQVSEDQLNKKPAPDTWSIGEIIDHIIISNEQYFPTLERVAAGLHTNPIVEKFPRLHTFFANSIIKAVDPDNQKKYQTVGKFRPTGGPYSLRIFEEFVTHQQRLVDYARASDHIDHTHTIIVSPASPLIFYSLESAFRIILLHELRHINQAMKIKYPEPQQADQDSTTPLPDRLL